MVDATGTPGAAESISRTFADGHLLTALAAIQHLKRRQAGGKSREKDELAPITEWYPAWQWPADEALSLKALDDGLQTFFRSDISPAIEEVRRDRIGELREWVDVGSLRDPNEEQPHDFVVLYAMRGVDAAAFAVDGQTHASWADATKDDLEDERIERNMRDRVTQNILANIAHNAAGNNAKFDPIELTFSVALLNRLSRRLTLDTPQLTLRAVECIVDAQDRDGSWPVARLISYTRPSLLHVASYEIVLALTDLLLRRLDERDAVTEDDLKLYDVLLPALRRALVLVRTQYNTMERRQGWANDHTRRGNFLESWATAVVLTFLIHYRDALLQLRQRLILARYEVAFPASPLGSAGRAAVRFAWPDLVPAIGFLPRHNKNHVDDALAAIQDPTDDRLLSGRLRDEFVDAVLHDWVRRPDKRSLIVYGPPGTGKSSAVRQVTNALRWPLLTLTPPRFLREGGIEFFEAAAERVFEDLLHLRRAVVFFDECEDFFKLRDPDQQLESRTTGAFITAGMLPRLQALGDHQWVIYVLATNSALDELDPAITRPGRFDFAVEIPHPTVTAQKRFVREEFEGRHGAKAWEKWQSLIESALEQFDAEEHLRESEDRLVVSFGMLRPFVKKPDDRAPLDDPSQASLASVLSKIRRLASQSGPEPLIRPSKETEGGGRTTAAAPTAGIPAAPSPAETDDPADGAAPADRPGGRKGRKGGG